MYTIKNTGRHSWIVCIFPWTLSLTFYLHTLKESNRDFVRETDYGNTLRGLVSCHSPIASDPVNFSHCRIIGEHTIAGILDI